MESSHVIYTVLTQVVISQQLLATTCPLFRDACLYDNTYAFSTQMQNVFKQDLFPLSCVSFCGLNERCMGANEAINSDMCQILEEDGIIPGLEWNNSQGYNFWSFEKPCPKVWYFYAAIIQIIIFFFYLLVMRPDKFR